MEGAMGRWGTRVTLVARRVGPGTLVAEEVEVIVVVALEALVWVA